MDTDKRYAARVSVPTGWFHLVLVYLDPADGSLVFINGVQAGIGTKTYKGDVSQILSLFAIIYDLFKNNFKLNRMVKNPKETIYKFKTNHNL